MASKISKVKLLNVPLEDDYKHTLYFESVNSQQAYFTSKKLYEDDEFSYIRKDNVIRYRRNIDDLQGLVNYVMYQNTSYDDKWFYAFIDKFEYVNDETTNIYIKTDVMQTWLFDYIVKPSYIEREHVNDDTIGLHTIEEGLEKGEYICNSYTKDGSLLNTRIIIGSTLSPGELDNSVGAVYSGVYSGIKYYGYETPNLVTESLQVIADEDANAIQSVFIVPDFVVGEMAGGIIEESNSVKYYTWNVAKDYEGNFKGQYKPKNNKLYTSPYCYLLTSNGNGGNAIYHYEDFSNANCEFRVDGVLCPGGSIRMHPLNYKGATSNYDEGLNLGKFPQCNWATDMYTNWLTQNGINVASSVINAGVTTVGGFLIGGGIGGIAGAVGGITSIANSLNEVKKAEMIAPQSRGNTNCGDVVYSAQQNTFHYYRMSIKPEYARMIDEFFSAYGYKCHRVKTPNKNHRTNYWFTQTIDANITGAVPMEDMKQIKSCYNNGITFWKNPANIKDYSVNNAIV